jgi:phosphoserine phosphatase
LPLLLKVDYPHVVNPDPTLLEHAQKAGWPVHSWK